MLTHWGRVTHICVSKLTIIGSDNGLSPDRRQPIIWTNARILLIGPLGTNFSEILIEILTFSFKKMRLKVLSAKRYPFCLGLNVLNIEKKRHRIPRMLPTIHERTLELNKATNGKGIRSGEARLNYLHVRKIYTLKVNRNKVRYDNRRHGNIK